MHHKYVHGQVGTSTYKSWSSMKERCLNTRANNYERYGGAGVLICDEWLEFINFYEDMGDRPEGTSLERKDNNKGYNKPNCCWADIQTQNNNKVNTTYISFNGLTLPLSEWSRNLGVKSETLRYRLKRGWPASEVLTKPVDVSKRNTLVNV